MEISTPSTILARNGPSSPQMYLLQSCIRQVVVGPFVDVPLLLYLVVI